MKTQKVQDSKFKTGFFPGSWDLIDVGKIRALREARSQCDFLVVGLQVDASIRDGKNKPIMPVEERFEILRSIWYVDWVLVYDTEELLHELDATGKFTYRFMGSDHRGKKHHPIKAKIIYVRRYPKYSSTKLRKKIYEAESLAHGK